MNFLLILLVVLTACAAPIARPVPTATARPTIAVTPTLIESSPIASLAPTARITPTIARTIAPPVTPAASIIYTSTDAILTLNLPANWIKLSGRRQLLATTKWQMDYLQLSSPGTPPQPAIIIFYNWQAADAIGNDNAWQEAFALASLAIKDCPMILAGNVGEPIHIAGEDAQFIGYTDRCGEQGELIGLVHHAVNVGMLIEAPQPLWEEWRPVLREIIGSIIINR